MGSSPTSGTNLHPLTFLFRDRVGLRAEFFVNRISDWIEKRSAALSQLGVSLRTEQAEIYTEWDGDEKVSVGETWQSSGRDF